MYWDEWRLARVYHEPLQRAGLSPGNRVLDIGGGAGEAAPLLAGMGLAHVNLDVAPFRRVHVLGSADALPFAEASFDAAIAAMVFGHIHCPERAIAEMARVLRPAGVGIIVQGNPYSYTLHWLRHRTKTFRGGRMSKYSLYNVCSPVEWRRMLESAGMQDIRVDYRGWLPEAIKTYTAGWVQRSIVLAGAALEKVNEALPLIRRAAIWHVVTARKPAPAGSGDSGTPSSCSAQRATS